MVREKLPSALEEVPTLEPLAVTEAPGTGVPLLASVILPVTVLLCAHENTGRHKRRVKTPTSDRFGIINKLSFRCINNVYLLHKYNV